MSKSLFVSTALIALLAAAPAARADDKSDKAAIAAADAWLKNVITFDDVLKPGPTKAAPLAYAMKPNSEAVSSPGNCKRVASGKATTLKQAGKVAECIASAFRDLFPAETDVEPEVTPWKVVTDPGAAPFNKAQKKVITAAAAGATLLTTTYKIEEDTMTVTLAVGADGAVRGVWMFVKSPYGE